MYMYSWLSDISDISNMQFWKSQMYGFAFEIEIEDYERILTVWKFSEEFSE